MGDEKVIALLLMQQIAVLFLIMGLGFLIVKLVPRGCAATSGRNPDRH